MNALSNGLQWQTENPVPLPISARLAHVRECSPFAAALLDRYPHWAEELSHPEMPPVTQLNQLVEELGIDAALRMYRNRCMLSIIWRDLCGLATLDQTFADLGTLAPSCLQAAVATRTTPAVCRLPLTSIVPAAAETAPRTPARCRSSVSTSMTSTEMVTAGRANDL